MADEEGIERRIEQCIAGDAEAQAALCADCADLIKNAVLRQLTRLSVSASEYNQADDFAQEVLERLLANDCALLRKLHQPRSLNAWLVTLARRHVIDRLRKDAARARYETAYVAEDRTEYGVSPESGEAAAERKEAVRRALSGLPDSDRIVLELYYVEGLRYAEISAILGLKINTCSARLRRAKAKLRQIIEESRDAF